MFNVIVVPLLAAVIAQGLKLVAATKKRPLTWQNLVAYSGMPSAHTAVVVALATTIGLNEGWDSSLFGLAFIFAFIVIRDAIGLRRYLGEHGKTLNILVKDLKEDDVLDARYPKLLEKIGHTPLQAMAGGLIGIIVALISYYFGL